jgi:hypothetical protein
MIVPAHSATRRPRRSRDRRITAAVLATLTLAVSATLASVWGPAYLAYGRYQPQEGDLVFQSLQHSPLVDAIEGVTQSPYSHCGIVGRQNGRWVVYEAYREVEATSLKEFLFRGRGHGFAVYRLKPEHRAHIPEMLHCAKSYLGRPYDVLYQFDDERIYCSELIFKAYRDASGGDQLGAIVKLGDLNWKPHEQTVRYYERGPVPVEREMITPRDLALANQLEPVFAFGLPTYGASP